MYCDYREAVSDAEPDVVSICLPLALHAPATVAAAQAGKHVITQKPLCRTFAEADRMEGSEWIATMADTYHMDLEGQDPAAEIASAGDRLHLVHVSDRDRTLPGEGGIDFAPIVNALKAQRYSGYLGFECRGPFELEHLLKSVCFMRALL